MSLLSLQAVDGYYGKAKILNATSLEVRRGERVAILGRNGVGKTTVVNVCLGIARVGAGQVAFHGRQQTTIRHFTAARS